MPDAPFWDFGSHLEYVKNIKKCDGDIAQMFTGDEGAGKSEAAMTFMLYLNPGFRLENVLMDMGHIIDFHGKAGYGEDVIYDEAISFLFSRDSMTKEAKAGVRLMNKDRFKNYNRIFCIPNKRWIDVYARSHRARIWVHVTAEHTVHGLIRGKAVVRWLDKYYDSNEQDYMGKWVEVYSWEFSPILDGDWRNIYKMLKQSQAEVDFFGANL